VLTGLAGLEVPVTNAIMTAVDPERFTIIDFRGGATMSYYLAL
jgi:hypothetical protein